MNRFAMSLSPLNSFRSRILKQAPNMHYVKRTIFDDSIYCALHVEPRYEGPMSLLSTRNTTSNILRVVYATLSSDHKIVTMNMMDRYTVISTTAPNSPYDVMAVDERY